MGSREAWPGSLGRQLFKLQEGGSGDHGQLLSVFCARTPRGLSACRRAVTLLFGGPGSWPGRPWKPSTGSHSQVLLCGGCLLWSVALAWPWKWLGVRGGARRAGGHTQGSAGLSGREASLGPSHASPVPARMVLAVLSFFLFTSQPATLRSHQHPITHQHFTCKDALLPPKNHTRDPSPQNPAITINNLHVGSVMSL